MFARQAVRTVSRQQVRFASSAAAPGAPKTLWQTWYEPAALPIFAVVGAACFGAGWYLTRLARGPDVIWDRHNNPEPWNGTQTKMMSNTPSFFTKQYSRDRL
ncbi:hypothetical protein JCM6882_002846 [Rhodosporidiobolus microsporus]